MTSEGRQVALDMLVAKLKEDRYILAAFRYDKNLWDGRSVYSLAQHYGFSLDTPFEDLPEQIVDVLLYGTKGERFPIQVPPGATAGKQYQGRMTSWAGIINRIERRYRKEGKASLWMEQWLKRVMVEHTCPDCGGKRLRRQRFLVSVGGRTIHELGEMHLEELVEHREQVSIPAGDPHRRCLAPTGNIPLRGPVPNTEQLAERLVRMNLTRGTAPLLMAALLLILTGCAPEPDPTAVAGAASAPAAGDAQPAQPAEPFDTRSRARDGMTLVYVPAGQFEMDGDLGRQAQPAHTVALDAFWIDQTEVTNAMFAAFLNDQGNQVEEDGVSWLEPGAGSRGIVYGYIDEHDGVFHPRAGYEDYPVVEVSWYGAAAYCAWAGARLPTEAEWAYAARGPESRLYPWGDDYDGTRANYCDTNCRYKWRDAGVDDGAVQWTEVGSYPAGASWCGALDMAGNVWEWVSDWWAEDFYARSPTDNPQGPASGTLHVARGASWFDEPYKDVTSRTGLTASSYRMHWVGVRCVVTTDP